MASGRRFHADAVSASTAAWLLRAQIFKRLITSAGLNGIMQRNAHL
jgi:hypothetical protein